MCCIFHAKAQIASFLTAFNKAEPQVSAFSQMCQAGIYITSCFSQRNGACLRLFQSTLTDFLFCLE